MEHEGERRQECREPDQRDAQAVHADDVIETKLGDPGVTLHVEQRDVRARRGWRRRDRRSEEDAPARVDEAHQQEGREPRLGQAEREGDELRQLLGGPRDPGDDRAHERDEDQEAEDVGHIHRPSPPSHRWRKLSPNTSAMTTTIPKTTTQA